MYDGDVTQERWALIDALFYLNKTGCERWMLPSDFPPWQTMHDHWRHWNRCGTWGKMPGALNEMHRKNGRRPAPSHGIVDSQSVKTVAASESRDYDGNKKTKGRKRHIVVYALGNLIQVLVHTAHYAPWVNGHDSKARLRHAEGGGQARLFGSIFGRRGLSAEPPSNVSRRH